MASALARNSVAPYRYGHLAHITDVHATVLRLAGFSEEEDTLDGFDLWDSMVKTQSPARQNVVINVNSPNFAQSAAVRWGKYKLIRNPEPMETAIYSRVQSKLIDHGMTVSQVRGLLLSKIESLLEEEAEYLNICTRKKESSTTVLVSKTAFSLK